MAIAPPSDLILDVARAADPQRALATTRALANAADGAPDFSVVLNAPPPPVVARDPYRNPTPFAVRTESPERKAAVGLESLFLKNFVDQMLPKDSAAVFGSGVAGDVWKSMLSEKIANQIARSGGLKIGERLFATHADLLRSPRAGAAAPASAGTQS